MSATRCHRLVGHSNVNNVLPNGRELGRTAKSTFSKVKDLFFETGANLTRAMSSTKGKQKEADSKHSHLDSRSRDVMAYYEDRKTQAMRWRGYF